MIIMYLAHDRGPPDTLPITGMTDERQAVIHDRHGPFLLLRHPSGE
jgi:hypothetical protein